MASENSSTPSPWLPWLKLARISAAPSAVSNILAGYLLANSSWFPVTNLFLLAISSISLYMSGMVLNDLCDIESDRINNPSRPIPSGHISKKQAIMFYGLLSLIGVATAGIASFTSLAVACMLVSMIYMYSSLLKKTVVAPWAMGSCRFLNILLGASTSNGFPWPPIQDAEWVVVWIASALGVFIVGLTLFAQNEVIVHSKGKLYRSVMLLVCGAFGFITAPWIQIVNKQHALFDFLAYFAVITLILLIVGRKVVIAVTFDPNKIRKTVGMLIKSLIFFDAAVCLLAAPYQFQYFIMTLTLFIPAFFLSKKIAST